MKVIIKILSEEYFIVNEVGRIIGGEFETYEEAETYAIENDLELVDSFFI